MYADIALNTKSSNRNDLFTYSIPPELEDAILIGQMVSVPLGSRKVNGIVIKIHERKPEFETKNIEKIIDPTPLVDEKMVELARYISEYYWAGIGQTIFSFLPVNLRKRKTRIFKDGDEKLLSCYLANLLNQGKANPNKITSYQANKLALSSYQQKALDKIFTALESKTPKPFLLHGVTNSGKTEVYLRSCAKVISSPKNRGQTSGIPRDRISVEISVESGGCIYIVPEIALTPQAIRRFEEVFGKERIALIHSKLSISQRLKAWTDIRTGKKDIVIGSRSAIFAPVQNLRLIIVDEEHDLISFKSDQTPRYELHNVAEKLAELSGSVLIFGSGTPLITSYKRVIDGDWDYLSMPEQVNGPSTPAVKIIDMEKEKGKSESGIFSGYLLEALKQVLNNKKQALLFLNRRGMASFIICNDCKKISMCESCDAALVHHYTDNKLWCHHCGRKYLVPERCGVCGGLDFRFLGKGTERIETEIKKYFPAIRIARMDRDTMTSDEAYQEIFEKFKAGEIDILIGTQMIVHGWDIPAVDLAAVISIDESLLMPDYLSEEKVFQLLTQLTGRVGRGNTRGMMVLQTESPDTWVFECVARNDYLSFAKRELAVREKFGYPPFSQLVKLSYGGANRELVEKKAEELKEKLEARIQKLEGIQIVGPISPLIEKKYGRYWKVIVIKLKIVRAENFLPVRDDILDLVPKDWIIDIDPIALL